MKQAKNRNVMWVVLGTAIAMGMLLATPGGMATSHPGPVLSYQVFIGSESDLGGAAVPQRDVVVQAWHNETVYGGQSVFEVTAQYVVQSGSGQKIEYLSLYWDGTPVQGCVWHAIAGNHGATAWSDDAEQSVHIYCEAPGLVEPGNHTWMISSAGHDVVSGAVTSVLLHQVVLLEDHGYHESEPAGASAGELAAAGSAGAGLTGVALALARRFT